MDETLKRKAYLDGMNLKNSGLDDETIYARLEKSGIPEELAKEVVLNMSLQGKPSLKKLSRERINISLIVIVIGIVAAIIAGSFSTMTIIPFFIIMGGVVGLIRALKSE